MMLTVFSLSRNSLKEEKSPSFLSLQQSEKLTVQVIEDDGYNTSVYAT